MSSVLFMLPPPPLTPSSSPSPHIVFENLLTKSILLSLDTKRSLGLANLPLYNRKGVT